MQIQAQSQSSLHRLRCSGFDPEPTQHFGTSQHGALRIPKMRHHFFLRLAYVGTRFFGWQIQPNLRSVQGTLWEALRKLDPDAPMPQGTGRTDAGVHARAQGVLVMTLKAWELYRLLAALNAHLPDDVRVMAVHAAPEAFWPRHHALAKRYVYRVIEGQAADPFLLHRRWHVRGIKPLDRLAITEAAQCLLGRHDFSSFRHQECSAASPIRTIYRADLVEDGANLDLVFEGDRFLMHQVRIMAGTLVDIGKGRIAAESMPRIIEARDRRCSGHTAPPHGLYLEEVWYQPEWGIGAPCPWGDTDSR
jgi:tRNA pseudouridine38-40 synthase